MQAPLLGQLLCPLFLGLMQTLLFRQLLRPRLLGLLQTLLFRQLLYPLLLGVDAPLLCQLLCACLLGLVLTLLLSELPRLLLFRLLHPLLIGEPLGTFLLSPLLPLLLGLALRFLTCPGLRVFGGALLGERRLELRGLFRELPPLLLGCGTQPFLRIGTQSGVVRFTLSDAGMLSFVIQTGAFGMCIFPGRRVVGDGLRYRRRFLHTAGRLRSGIGFHGRERDLERRRLLRFPCDHAGMQAIGHTRRRRLATAFCRLPRWRRGRRRRRRGHDGIDEPEAVMQYIRRRIRLRLRQRHGRRCRRLGYGRDRRRRLGRERKRHRHHGRGRRQPYRDRRTGAGTQAGNAELQRQYEAVQQQGPQHTHREPALGSVHGRYGSCRGGVGHAGRGRQEWRTERCPIDSTAYTRQ
ncbi:hypothetical protein HAV22_23090 [Massilia sp. TW-1]|uniref:Uncharacterized protein n=1 Tax=Telluria antibiotica TaxID=2717319 RepID=A0ABX0PH88_9BURK|nr:hypothetical protein [Telluria antibiotica]NIA56517.1 hypothetical protein [Telluria antibiotica]